MLHDMLVHLLSALFALAGRGVPSLFRADHTAVHCDARVRCGSALLRVELVKVGSWGRMRRGVNEGRGSGLLRLGSQGTVVEFLSLFYHVHQTLGINSHGVWSEPHRRYAFLPSILSVLGGRGSLLSSLV